MSPVNNFASFITYHMLSVHLPWSPSNNSAFTILNIWMLGTSCGGFLIPKIPTFLYGTFRRHNYTQARTSSIYAANSMSLMPASVKLIRFCLPSALSRTIVFRSTFRPSNFFDTSLEYQRRKREKPQQCFEIYSLRGCSDKKQMLALLEQCCFVFSGPIHWGTRGTAQLIQCFPDSISPDSANQLILDLLLMNGAYQSKV